MKAGDSQYQDRVVRLHDLVPDSGPSVIDGYTFDGCHIIGPAIVAIQATEPGAGGMMNCSLDGTPDATFIQLASEQNMVNGAIILRDCHFSRCKFQNVGFLDKDGELRTRFEGN